MYETFAAVSYMGKLDYGTNISLFIEPVMTDEGLCYSFNMLPSTELFTETTYVLRCN